MKRTRHFAGLVFIMLMARPSEAQGFRRVATYRGLGGLVASAVGPGQRPGTERLYLSYLYVDHTIDVVAVDPNTGRDDVFSNPAPTESGARCMTVGRTETFIWEPCRMHIFLSWMSKPEN
ncbi:MAG TPA: hypothetical protein VN737_17060 [Bryobacteraceae bacterium]|nr:hypothetical protein [Bryobacteraceae bacterium]